MRRVALLAIPLALSATVVAGCGGLSASDQKSADSLAAKFSQSTDGSKPSKAVKSAGRCLADEFVSKAGVDALKSDKVLTTSGKATKTLPTQMSEKVAVAYAAAYTDCLHVQDFKADYQRQTGATSAQIDQYIACFNKVPAKELRQAIVDDRTHQGKQTAMSRKVQGQLTKCRSKLAG